MAARSRRCGRLDNLNAPLFSGGVDARRRTTGLDPQPAVVRGIPGHASITAETFIRRLSHCRAIAVEDSASRRQALRHHGGHAAKEQEDDTKDND